VVYLECKNKKNYLEIFIQNLLFQIISFFIFVKNEITFFIEIKYKSVQKMKVP